MPLEAAKGGMKRALQDAAWALWEVGEILKQERSSFETVLSSACSVRRSEEKQAEIEELRAEVRRGEARLRTLHRDMKAQQDKAELHSKFSTQYLSELEDLRSHHTVLMVRSAAPGSTSASPASLSSCILVTLDGRRLSCLAAPS